MILSHRSRDHLRGHCFDAEIDHSLASVVAGAGFGLAVYFVDFFLTGIFP